jgi:hypothetical protein
MKIRNTSDPIDLIHALIAKHVGWVWILLPVYILAWVFLTKNTLISAIASRLVQVTIFIGCNGNSNALFPAGRCGLLSH